MGEATVDSKEKEKDPPKVDSKEEVKIAPKDTRTEEEIAADEKLNKICTGVLSAVLVLTVVALLAGASLLIYITPKISKNFKSICDEGICYEITDLVLGNKGNPSYNGLLGLKNNLKLLNKFGIETIIINMKYIDEGTKETNLESLEKLFLESRKVGISIIFSLDMSDEIVDSTLIEKSKVYAQGFLLIGEGSYKTYKEAIGSFTFYIHENAVGNIQNLPEGCSGVFRTLSYVKQDFDKLLNDIYKVGPESGLVNVVGLKNMVSSIGVAKDTEFLTSFSLLSMVNGSVLIEGGEEILNLNPNKYFFSHHSHPIKEMQYTHEKMKEIYQLRKHSPCIGKGSNLKIEKNENIYFIKRYNVQNNVHACLIFNHGSVSTGVNIFSLFPHEDINKFNVLFSLYDEIEAKDLKADHIELKAGSIVILTVSFNEHSSTSENEYPDE